MEGRWAPQLNYCIEQTGINLEVVHIPHGSYSERMLLLELVGDTPDLVIIPPERIAAIVNAGLLMDVQPLVERDLDDLDMWFPPAIRATQFQGITFGLPAYVVNYTYAYNKNIFNERGITPPAIDEWLTWEQVYENARKANEDRDGDGVPEIWGFYNGTNFVQTLAMIRQAGGEVFTEDGFVQFNSPPVHEAVDFLLELVDAKLHPDSQYLFNEGRLASIRLGSGSLVVDRTDDDPTPIGVGAGIMNVRKADVAYFTSWAIPRSSSKPEAAWEFMKFLVSAEAQRVFGLEYGIGGVPLVTSLVPEYVAQPSPPDSWDAFVTSVQRGRMVYHPPNADEIFNALNVGWGEMIRGETPVRTWFDAVAPVVRTILERAQQ